MLHVFCVAGFVSTAAGSSLIRRAHVSNSGLIRTLPSSSSGSSNDAWHDAASWLESNGGTVNHKAAGNLTLHGGFSVRGVIAQQSISSGEVLLSIPKPLWLHWDNFNAQGLSSLSCGSSDYLRLGVALALEDKKGSSSKWHAYLRNLPSLENYNSFYLQHATEETLRQFEGLGLVQSVRTTQKKDREAKICFEQWKHRNGHAALTWEDVLLGLARWRTRCYGVTAKHQKEDRGSALIPASDLLNTGRHELLNTAWSDTFSDLTDTDAVDDEGHRAFRLVTSMDVPAGQELYDSYCPNCDNQKFLSTWGVYLEDNNNVMAQSAAQQQKLKKTVLSILESTSSGFTAPRCKEAVLREAQGSIKCALARLAWEQHSAVWHADKGNRSMLVEASALMPSTTAGASASSAGHLIFNARGMVLPESF